MKRRLLNLLITFTWYPFWFTYLTWHEWRERRHSEPKKRKRR